MISIVIKDPINKHLEVLKNLREETEFLISSNINTINKVTNKTIQIESYVDEIENYWIENGYSINQSLYDKLIIDYNLQYTPLLTRWV